VRERRPSISKFPGIPYDPPMRTRHVVSGSFLLMAFLGCQDRTKQDATQAASAQVQGLVAGQRAAQAQALAQAASAQALASAAVQEAPTTVTGKMHSVGGELGTWDIALGECASGESLGFYGADFFVAGSEDLRLRYVHDEAKGDIVKIGIPSKKGSVLVPDRNACTVLEGSVEKTNFKTWTPTGEIRHLNGHVKFDCKVSDGKGHVTGEATFSHCH
jgi:hypothetical protein